MEENLEILSLGAFLSLLLYQPRDDCSSSDCSLKEEDKEPLLTFVTVLRN